MRRYLNFQLYILLISLLTISCRKIDNYSAPNAGISGTITDSISGKPFLTEQPDGVMVVFLDQKYNTPEPINIWAMQDGSFNNSALFNGKYEVYLDQLAGIPSAMQIVNTENSGELHFTVTPFLSIDTVSISVAGKTITVKYKITKNVASESLADRALFLNDVPRVSQKDNVQSVIKTTNVPDIFTDKITAPGYGVYYLRIGAKTNNPFGRYNYSETIKLTLVSNGEPDNNNPPGIEQGRMFESFFQSSALDAWQTKYNFTTEFLAPGKVRLTMGTIDGYGIFAKNIVAYNVTDFPILGIKVFNAPPNADWLIKLSDGTKDVVASGDMALGTVALPDGSSIYYWDLGQLSGWTGDIVTNVQVAVVGSSQPLTFGWIRTFNNIAAVADEDVYQDGRIFEMFTDVSALDVWTTKYNFTTEFLMPGKVRITMGTIDGYGIFATNNVDYNVDNFPILGIQTFGTPPSDKWLIKLNDGSIDVVANASQAKGIKILADGSQVYYWDFRDFSPWSGDKTSNIQIAVVGSFQPLTFGWVKTFSDLASIK